MKLMLIYMSILLVRATQISSGLPRPAMLLFNRPSRCILPRFSRLPIGCGTNESKHSALINWQPQTSTGIDTHKIIHFLVTGSTVAVQWEDEGPLIHGIMVGHWADDHKARSCKIKTDEDGMHNNHDEETYEEHSNISWRLSEEGDIQEQQTTDRWQTQQTCRLLCCTEPAWTLK